MSWVTDYLELMGIPFDVLRHATVKTAIEEADSLGVPPEVVAKTIVLDVGPAHVLAVVPASRRLDMRLLRSALRRHDVHLATEEELDHHFPQYELGSLPPLGSLVISPVMIDPELVQHDTVVFAAGSREESIRIRTQDLLELEHAVVTAIAESPEDEDRRDEHVS